jgi:TRAP-type C4-dicarboxylate transport system permease small subunit
MRRLASWLDKALQLLTIGLLVVLAVVVVVGVGFRYTGNALIWYDEVASLLLAWITFTGAGLAALRNGHLAFNGLLYAAPLPLRRLLFIVVELVFVAAFVVIGWAGWAILAIFGSETLVTLPGVTLAQTRIVLPVAAAVIVLARLLTLPSRWTELEAGHDPEKREIEEEIARAERELAREGESRR